MRRLLIRWITPLAWNSSDARLARSMSRFADVEADSGWQAQQLLNGVENPKLKAEFFEIALEESAHSRMFRQVALRLDREIERSWHPPEREALFDPSEARGLIDAVADLVVNERSVYAEFAHYALATKNQGLISVFDRIRKDESEHGECASEILAELSADQAEMRRALRAARMRRFWRSYSVVSKAMGGVMMRLLLRVAFYAFAGIYRRSGG